MQMFRRSRSAVAGALALLVVAGFISVARAQQVMEQIPDDALMVLKVRNLTATSTKLGKIMTDLGLAAMQPGLDNPLALAQQQLQMTQGVRTDGELAVVYRDPEKSGEEPDKSVLILVPVTDFAAFVANFGGAKPEAAGAVTTVKMPKSNEDGFIAQWGNFAAMSPSKLVVEKKPSAMLKVSGDASNRELAGRDIVFFANFAAMRPKMMDGLKQGREHAMEGIAEMANDQSTAKFQPVVKSLAGQVFNALEAFVRDSNGVTVSLNFGDMGINGALLCDFVSESYIGSTLAQWKNTDKSMLAGLPTGKYLVYGGQSNQPEVATKIVEDFAAPILKELDAVGPEMKPAHEYVAALLAYMKACKGNSFGLLAPSGALGQESILQLVSVAEGDAPAMKVANQKMVKSQEELMKALGMPADSYNATITANAKTIDGVAFDSITSNFNANANDPTARQQQQIMSMVYGPGGMNMLQGEVNGKFMLAMGVSDEVLTNAIATTKNGASPLTDSKGVKAVAPHLPAKRIMEMYIPLDQIVTTAAGYAKAFGAPINVNLQPDLPPIGVSTSTDGPAFRVDGHIPTALIQQLVAAGMQTYMQMQGGGGDGGK